METLAANVARMVASYIHGPHFYSEEYHFDNGTMMVVSRNALIGGHKSGLVGVLPHDKAGNAIDARAEDWLTTMMVAEKMAILASE